MAVNKSYNLAICIMIETPSGLYLLTLISSLTSQNLTLIYLLFLHWHTANVDYNFQNSKKHAPAQPLGFKLNHSQLLQVCIYSYFDSYRAATHFFHLWAALSPDSNMLLTKLNSLSLASLELILEPLTLALPSLNLTIQRLSRTPKVSDLQKLPSKRLLINHGFTCSLEAKISELVREIKDCPRRWRVNFIISN